MKLAFSTLACVDWDLEKVASVARRFGYDGVELRVSGEQHVSPDFTAPKRTSVRRLFRHNELEIACLSAYTRFGFAERNMREQQIRELRRTIDLAHDLECPYVRTFGASDISPEAQKEHQISWIADALRTVADYAEHTGGSGFY